MKINWYTGDPVLEGWYIVYANYTWEEQHLVGIQAMFKWSKVDLWHCPLGYEILYWTYLLDEPTDENIIS
jgi:hypothetical protein